MGDVADREFNLEGWGSDKRLIEGRCGHCGRAVSFKPPEGAACLSQVQRIAQAGDDTVEERTHFFIIGVCPRPRCQESTVVYRVESVTYFRDHCDRREIVTERVVFPQGCHRASLPDDVPASIRTLFHEASLIEGASPSGAAFIARRIVEQCLRERFGKVRGRLADLIEEFLQIGGAAPYLHLLMEDVRQFGNIAGHPARDDAGDWTSVEPSEAAYTLDVVEELLDHLYVKPKHQAAMRERWQAKRSGRRTLDERGAAIVVGGCEKAASEGAPDDDLPF